MSSGINRKILQVTVKTNKLRIIVLFGCHIGKQVLVNRIIFLQDNIPVKSH